MIKREFRNIFFLIPLLIVLTGVVPSIVKSEMENDGQEIKAVKTPNIHFKEEKYKFGEAEPDEIIKHIFHFTNTGDDKLIISDVRAKCKCISLKIFSKEILPGETGEIEVLFDLGKESGMVLKIVTVHSNDPGQPSVGLKLLGLIKTEVFAYPSYLGFSKLLKKYPSTRELYILKGKNKDFAILKIEADSDDINFEDPVPAYKMNREGYVIKVGLNSELPIGRFQGILKIHTNSIEQPIIEVTVGANVSGELSVKPGIMNILFLPYETTSKETIKLTNYTSEKVIVTGIKNTLKEYIKVSVTSIRDGFEYEITGVPLKETEQKIIKGEIQIEIDYKKQPMIKVPLLIYNKKLT